MENKVVFEQTREGTGTKEWAEHTENICLGCHNDCVYCYAAFNADRQHSKSRADWHKESFTNRSRMTCYSHKEGVIMFPTTHDITEFNVDECIRVLKLMLEANNKVLIVSKPNPKCVKKLIKELKPYKQNVMFRFTIGTSNNKVLKLFEPNAPSYRERERALKMAFKAGYRTSVSMEPMLCAADLAFTTIINLQPYVTDSIWIGKLNKAELRIDESRMTEKLKLGLDSLLLWQNSDTCIYGLVGLIQACGEIEQQKIQWKDSIKEVMKKFTNNQRKTNRIQ